VSSPPAPSVLNLELGFRVLGFSPLSISFLIRSLIPSCVCSAVIPEPEAIGDGGSDGVSAVSRRRSRLPSGRHRLWPGTGEECGDDDVTATVTSGGASRRCCASFRSV
jgi:hypothetical protein